MHGLDEQAGAARPWPLPNSTSPKGIAPAGAVRAPLPQRLAPQLATLATAVPGSGRWIYENKFDGYRLLTRIDGGRPRLLTRNGHDWTERMPELAAELAGLTIETAWLDGEIVVAGARGGHDFNKLQNAFDGERTQGIHYHLFDLPFLEGQDLRQVPLRTRRELLHRLLQAHRGVRLHFSAALGQGDGAAAVALLKAACSAGCEGLIAKRDDAPYSGARDTSWLKLKCQQRQEFVVGGYSARSDDDSAVGRLILGVHDAAGKLQHAGSVGTGWGRAAARGLLQRLRKLERPTAPFAGRVGNPGHAQPAHWVQPRLVVEVNFGEWTPAGRIRHASFVALRSDKPARAITRERPLAPGEIAASNGAGRPASQAAAAQAKSSAAKTRAPLAAASMKLTHPERVIDAASGLTKGDLARYYDSVAEFLLPQLKGRPVALVRAPQGVDGPMFFQRHGGAAIPGVRELDAALSPGQEPLLEISTLQALRSAAQLNVVEFHTWNALARHIDRPDRVVFDLDPGQGVAWPAIQEAAQLTRAVLQELGLQSWLKTSGGKGLHLMVPIAARWPHDVVRNLAHAVVQHLARSMPSRFVAKSGAANRVGRIFIDYLRNGEGATTVAAFSARARPGLGVSMPLDWDELAQLESAAQWTIANARDRLSARPAQPWAGIPPRQAISSALKALKALKGSARRTMCSEPTARTLKEHA